MKDEFIRERLKWKSSRWEVFYGWQNDIVVKEYVENYI